MSRSTASGRYLTGPVTTGCLASGLKKYASYMYPKRVAFASAHA